jgi:hypothetical protein
MRIDMRNKVLCNNGTYDRTNGAEAPCESAGGVKQQSFDWKKIDVKNLFNQGFPDLSKVTSTPVICKDGTTQIQKSSPNAEFMDACVNNGGRAENKSTTKPATNSSKNMTKMHIGLFVGGVVVGYFLLKILKK